MIASAHHKTRNAMLRRNGIDPRGLATALAFAIVMAGANLASADGRTGAAAVTAAALAAPVDLSGRWSGPRSGFGKLSTEIDCGGKPCTITYDIVPCNGEWCGIAVSDTQPCGAVGLRLAPSKEDQSPRTFDGNLELEKGSAAYVIRAWYEPGITGGERTAKPARLGMIGDTGGELMMLRRSFPFSANLTRISDATCTLEKATS